MTLTQDPLGKITRIDRFRKLVEVDAYWHALRQGAALPSRSEIDPRGIEGALANTFILERIAPGMARIRIAGNVLSDILGMEVRGMPVSALMEPEARDPFRDVLDTVFSQPAVARLSLSAERGLGRPSLEGQMLLLPLRSDFGEISRAMGCIEMHGRVGRTPRRMTVTGSFVRPVSGVDQAPARHMAGFAEPSASFTPAKPEIKTRQPRADAPHLRVVIND